MALGAFAEAPAGSKTDIMARSAMALGTGNNSAPGFLAHLAKLFGIAMPYPPEGSKTPFQSMFSDPPHEPRSLSSLISPPGGGLLGR
jgi:hypothetical protein